MSEGVVQHTLTIRGFGTEDIHAAMADSLRAEGWTVDPPGYSYFGIAKILTAEGWTVLPPATPGETPLQFCRRVGVSRRVLYHAFERGGHPPIRRQMGEKGVRTLAMWSTPEFETWIKRHQPNTKP